MSRDDDDTTAPSPGDETPAEAQARKFQRELSAGLTSLVYGPGDIAQAHTADEFVTLEQLQRYTAAITRILGNETT